MRDFADIQGARLAFKQLSDRLDQLQTKNNDLHGRRIVNAGSAKDANDYLTLADAQKLLKPDTPVVSETSTEASIIGGIVVHRLAHTFNKVVKFLAGIITGLIYPAADSTNAIKFTKADGVTNIFTIDSTNKVIVLENAVPLNVKNAAGTIHNLFGHFGDDNVYLDNQDGSIYFRVTGSFFTRIQLDSTGIGFWASTPAAKQTLNGYTTNSQSAAYTATPAALANAATLADLNTLRVAYENIRASHDDLQTKIRATTLVG